MRGAAQSEALDATQLGATRETRLGPEIKPKRGSVKRLREENLNEERFARQDQRRYNGWSNAITIIVILIVLASRHSCLSAKVLARGKQLPGARFRRGQT